MKARWCLLSVLLATAASAGYRVAGVVPLEIGPLADRGQVAEPEWSPDGRALGFEFLGAEGDTLQVFVAEVTNPGAFPPKCAPPVPVLSAQPKDPFSLQGRGRTAVSEFLTWAPPKGMGQRIAVAATREALERGAPQVSFNIFLSEPGRKRFLTSQRDNADHPAFSPDGEFLAFTSGSTGQGDLYLYHFYAERDPLIQLTFEPAGSEIYAVWDPSGNRLAYTGHLGGVDHIYVLDDVPRLAAERDPSRRKSMFRQLVRDLTPKWKGSCLAPSFSPDGKWVAFYARETSDGGADLYVVPAAGGTPRRLLDRGLPETRRGPRWSPDGDGLFAVRESAERLNPLVWVPLAQGAIREVPTGTQLNADPHPRKAGDSVFLLFTAQGAQTEGQKRWRRPFAARLIPERAN